jgi:hypothetical protein
MSSSGKKTSTTARSVGSTLNNGASAMGISKRGLHPVVLEPVTFDDGIVLEAALSGYNTPAKIAAKTGFTREEIQRVWDDPKFQLSLLGARRDMGIFVVNWVKKNSLKYAKQMDALALEAGDERVRFQAAKDLLDRAGTAGQTKVALGTPQAYKNLIEELATEDTSAPDNLS